MPLLLVTGATGFLGSHFLQTASKQGLQIRALTRNPNPPPPPNPKVHWLPATLANPSPEWFDGVNAIVHLAAAGVSPKPTSWEEAFQVNLLQSFSLFQTAAQAGVLTWIAIGTCMEYGLSANSYNAIPPNAPLLPSGPYATSKAAFSTAIIALARQHRAHLAYLRPFHFFGSGQSESNFFPSLQRAALSGEDFPMTLGEQIRVFTPVETIAALILQHTLDAIATIKPQILLRNLADGPPRTLLSFAQEWWQRWQAKGRLLPGAIPYRPDEIPRYVPSLEPLLYPL